MKCKYEYDGDCCNCGSPQYMCKCKPKICHMELTDITAILWIALAGYGFSVFRGWKKTASHTREKLDEMMKEWAQDG